MILAVANAKGGVGKSHISYKLARLLAEEGRTLLVDADVPQQSALRWAVLAQRDDGVLGPLDVAPAGGVPEEGDENYAEWEHYVFDTPPGHPEIILETLVQAEVALIPVTPGDIVVDQLPTIRLLVEKAMQENPGLRVWVVLNCMEAGTREAKGELREAVVAAGWQVLDAEIPRRVAIQRDFGQAGPPAPGASMEARVPWEPYEAVLAELLDRAAGKRSTRVGGTDD